MPLYYFRCYEPNHSADEECPRSRRNNSERRQLCNSTTHPTSICPNVRQDPQLTSRNSFRSRRKTSLPASSASPELLKSTYAPTNSKGKNPHNNIKKHTSLTTTMGQYKSAHLTSPPNNNNNNNCFAVLTQPETLGPFPSPSTTPQEANTQSFGSMEVNSETDLQAHAELKLSMGQHVGHYMDDSVTKPAPLFTTNITTQHLLELPPDWIYRLKISKWWKEVLEQLQPPHQQPLIQFLFMNVTNFTNNSTTTKNQPVPRHPSRLKKCTHTMTNKTHK
ncbi:hypothetical protein INT45_014077 [Circinella minor]|uniref:Uncharacterized protein n=1 Tax=Circinella minor TaxID=1195481 RepID=A0A8H7S2N5_9FUNG|nr:hypothetical protein INT45_014077 [Circinella minor]